jgi:hypothetical protein
VVTEQLRHHQHKAGLAVPAVVAVEVAVVGQVTKVATAQKKVQMVVLVMTADSMVAEVVAAQVKQVKVAHQLTAEKVEMAVHHLSLGLL